MWKRACACQWNLGECALGWPQIKITCRMRLISQHKQGLMGGFGQNDALAKRAGKPAQHFNIGLRNAQRREERAHGVNCVVSFAASPVPSQLLQARCPSNLTSADTTAIPPDEPACICDRVSPQTPHADCGHSSIHISKREVVTTRFTHCRGNL